MLAVNSQSKHIEKTVEYLDTFYANDDLYMLFHYGIEGKHYSVENGFLNVVSGSSYSRGVTWSMGSQFQQLPVKGQPKTVWEETKKLNATARKSPILGFVFDPTNVAGEIGQCRSVYDEYVLSIFDGTRSISDYDEMLTKFEAAGSQKIVDELQKQIDAWAAAK